MARPVTEGVAILLSGWKSGEIREKGRSGRFSGGALKFGSLPEKSGGLTCMHRMTCCKTSSMQRFFQVAQRVVQKSFCTACQLFCCPVDALRSEKVAWCHQPAVALRNLASTILIVNISNSTLIDCVIGSDNYPCAVAEGRPLMPDSQLQMQGRCSCSCGQQGAAQSPPPPPTSLSINIHSSRLNCVIIGDNNYMQAEQTHLTETEEPIV
ncbi:uncharacterized protein si:dkey-29h14.10 isoform X2 [Pungitius pungitius]|uniref:uncharacterized protein si:dkey-29h14.10 isoform X2 n=1 Tax=Pungitius pungitius TaxID=134920 RepID=UPI002E0E405F